MKLFFFFHIPDHFNSFVWHPIKQNVCCGVKCWICLCIVWLSDLKGTSVGAYSDTGLDTGLVPPNDTGHVQYERESVYLSRGTLSQGAFLWTKSTTLAAWGQRCSIFFWLHNCNLFSCQWENIGTFSKHQFLYHFTTDSWTLNKKNTKVLAWICAGCVCECVKILCLAVEQMNCGFGRVSKWHAYSWSLAQFTCSLVFCDLRYSDMSNRKAFSTHLIESLLHFT